MFDSWVDAEKHSLGPFAVDSPKSSLVGGSSIEFAPAQQIAEVALAHAEADSSFGDGHPRAF
jgi:hypothetical protein